MSPQDNKPLGHTLPRTQFLTTRWSLILAAGAEDTAEARLALGALFETYWYPVYVYIRRRTSDPDRAQDLAQDFFVRLLEKEFFSQAQPERGRFRSFLLASARHFLINEYHRESAQKRGGGKALLSLDFKVAERRFALEPVDRRSPESLFERQWALTLVETTLKRLEDELRRFGNQERFERLKGFLTETSPDRYADAAKDLEISEGAVKVAVHRLRRRFASLLREAVTETLESPEDVDHEIRHLFSILRESD